MINSKIENSIIGEQSYIMPYCFVHDNAFIGNFCTLKSYSEIENTSLKDNTTIESYTKLINGEKVE